MQRIRDQQVIIGSLEGGQYSADLSGTITGAVAEAKALATTPKKTVKAKVTATFDIEVEYGGLTSITGDIAVKLPKKPRQSTVFWATDDGSLSTEHPMQQDMFAPPR